MKFVSKVGERGQVVIPKAIREEFGIGKNSAVEFETDGGRLIMTPKNDMRAFDAALEKWRGALREDFLADGYTSVDEFIDEIRGR